MRFDRVVSRYVDLEVSESVPIAPNLESMQVLQLIFDLESELGITVPLDNINSESLQDAESLRIMFARLFDDEESSPRGLR